MSQERLGSLRVVPHEDLGDAGRLGHALDLERELPRRMSVLLEGWMDCSRGRRVNVDPSALTWRRKTFTNGALGLAGWCRSALAFRRRVLRWRDNLVPGPGHGVGYRLACVYVYGVSVVPFLVAPEIVAAISGVASDVVLVACLDSRCGGLLGCRATNSSIVDAVSSASSWTRWRWRESRQVPSRITDFAAARVAGVRGAVTASQTVLTLSALQRPALRTSSHRWLRPLAGARAAHRRWK